MQRTELPFYDAAILARLVVEDDSSLTPAAAEGLLALRFDPADKDRMRDLAAKARAGSLTAEEQAQVEAYSRVGSLIGILHSRARRALRVRRGTNGKSKPD